MATKVVSVTPKAVSGQMATFAAETDLVAPYKYHWKKDGAYIAGAPSAKTYTTPPLQQQDLKALFSVVVYGQDATEESAGIALNKDIPDAVTVTNEKPPAIDPVAALQAQVAEQAPVIEKLKEVEATLGGE
jgi:hypothetical protein